MAKLALVGVMLWFYTLLSVGMWFVNDTAIPDTFKTLAAKERWARRAWVLLGATTVCFLIIILFS